MPCTRPSPTLENPIPATYWPSAIASPAPASPATEPRSAPAMISMALRCRASVKAQAALADVCTGGNPREASLADIVGLYQAAW